MFGARLLLLVRTPLFAFVEFLVVFSIVKFKPERHARNFHIRTAPLPRCEKELNRVLRFKIRPTLLAANLLGTSVLRCGFLGGGARNISWLTSLVFFNLGIKTMSMEFLESPRNMSDNRFTVNIYHRNMPFVRVQASVV